MTLEKQTRILNEVCSVGKLEQYRHRLAQSFNTIYKSGCKVSTRYDVGYSNIEDNIEGGNHIRISLKNVKDPLDIIWKLLHEYGHFLSGKRKPSDSTIYREELAWSYADKFVQNCPELILKEELYNRCKEECLNFYSRSYRTK